MNSDAKKVQSKPEPGTDQLGDQLGDEGAEAILALCETQLIALEEETRLRFEKMADLAVASLSFAEAVADGAGQSRSEGVQTELDSLAGAIEQMTTEFQFFDEYAQRMQHVREAITLLRGQSFGRVDLDLLKPILIRVFSLQSEQKGLAEHLPDFVGHSNDSGPSVELF